MLEAIGHVRCDNELIVCTMILAGPACAENRTRQDYGHKRAIFWEKGNQKSVEKSKKHNQSKPARRGARETGSSRPTLSHTWIMMSPDRGGQGVLALI